MTDKNSTPTPAPASLYEQSRAYIEESSPERIATMSKVLVQEVSALGARLNAASEEHDLNMTILLTSTATLILFGIATAVAETQKARTIELVGEVSDYTSRSLLNMALAELSEEAAADEELAK